MIEKLAREIAEQDTRCEIPEVHDAAVKLNADLIKRILDKILRTHCIVSKKKVKEAYEQATDAMQSCVALHNFTGESNKNLLESLFGPDMFKDNGNE